MLIVALVFASLISVSLVSYIKLCTNSLKLAHRTMFATNASNLVEAGLDVLEAEQVILLAGDTDRTTIGNGVAA